MVLGALVLAGDALAGSEDATTREVRLAPPVATQLLGGSGVMKQLVVRGVGAQARERARSPAFVALCFGVLAAVLQLSAWAQGPLEGP